MDKVFPRDFFNDAKLLKCLGRVALSELFDFELDGPWDIELGDWGLSVTNLQVYYLGLELFLYIPYNSKSDYPLYCVGYNGAVLFNGHVDPLFVEWLDDQINQSN